MEAIVTNLFDTIQFDPFEKPDEHYWLTEKQVAKILSVSVSTLRAHRQARKGIPYAKFGRLVRYSLADVAEFLKHVSFHSKCKVWGQRTDTVQQFKEPGQRSVPRIF